MDRILKVITLALIYLGKYSLASRIKKRYALDERNLFASVARSSEDSSATWGAVTKAVSNVASAVTKTVDNTWPFDNHNHLVPQINANTNAINGQAGHIANNAGNIAANANNVAGNAGNIANNAGNIATNAQNVAGNAGNIANNAGNIVNNAGNIATNAQNVAGNAGNIVNNAGNIATNANNIAGNAGNIVNNAGNIATNAQNVAGNAGNIATNAQNVAGNAGNIVNNAGNIATNAQNVAGNAGNIANNAGNIATNAQNVAGNAGNIANNAGNIATNAQNVAGNAGNIANNAGNIATNAQNVAGNTGNIVNNAGNIATNAQNVAGNAGNIATNAQNIAGNAGNIGMNAGNIANNAQNIATNTGNIGLNAGNIATNAQNIAGNAGNIANNAGNIATNAQNIAGNSAAIGTNAQNIANVANLATNNAGNIATNAANIAGNSNAIAANAQNIANVGNMAVTNAGNIATNAQNIASVGNLAASNAGNIAVNAQAIASVGNLATQNSAQIQGLVSSVGMLSGSVAANSLAIAELGTQVAVLSEVAAPTIALANMLGLSVGTVSTLSLAGSFTAPVLGVLMLIYVCWPDEKNDPWWKLEARVEQMITDRFNEERRKRLTGRLKRYIKEFTRCSAAWIAHANSSQVPGQEISSMMQLAAHHISGKELDAVADTNFATVFTPLSQATPPCMEQLEMHMSLEQDEWMVNKEDSLTGLFMPFANLHTQVQHLLTDFPAMTNREMDWARQAQKTAGAYGGFMVNNMLNAWKSQVCRTVRLRKSKKSMYKHRYGLVALSPIWQPHAGQTCWNKCGSKSGWCQFCGGKGVGACCMRGGASEGKDPSECKQFDVPAFKKERVCVHADCEQTNTRYSKGKTLSKQLNVTNWQRCQEHCRLFLQHSQDGSPIKRDIFFTMTGNTCLCKLPDQSFQRVVSKGSVSGPIECPALKFDDPTQSEEDKSETPHIPMEELYMCTKSPPVQKFESIEAKHGAWLRECYTNVSKVVAVQFNPFYQRFASFVDQLAWKAGCGPYPDHNLKNVVPEDFSETSTSFDFKQFSECDWDLQAKNDKNQEWVPDALRTRGWTKTSKVTFEEQAMLTTSFPLPAWLERRRSMLSCLMHASGADVKADNPEIGAAVANLVSVLPDGNDILPPEIQTPSLDDLELVNYDSDDAPDSPRNRPVREAAFTKDEDFDSNPVTNNLAEAMGRM